MVAHPLVSSPSLGAGHPAIDRRIHRRPVASYAGIWVTP
jgi:hypothetical protein